MTALPSAYAWLADEGAPRILVEGLKTYGTLEKQGPGSNPEILRWAEEVGLEHVYRNDAIAWCGLWMAYTAGQAGWDMAPRGNALWARNWAFWGNPSPDPSLADVLVFERAGGFGHVGLYVGEDSTAYHVLGGNQSDSVSFTRIDKNRLITARRCPWRIAEPKNVRAIALKPTGALSTNEA